MEKFTVATYNGANVDVTIFQLMKLYVGFLIAVFLVLLIVVSFVGLIGCILSEKDGCCGMCKKVKDTFCGCAGNNLRR